MSAAVDASDAAGALAIPSDAAEGQASQGDQAVDFSGNVYPNETEVILTGLFYQGTTPADPTTINLFLQDPSGNVTEYTYPTTGMSRSSEGAYAYSFTPSGPGVWAYKWQGTGAVVATSFDRSFMVLASALLSP